MIKETRRAVLVLIPTDLLDEAGVLARAHGTSRSGLIRDGLKRQVAHLAAKKRRLAQRALNTSPVDHTRPASTRGDSSEPPAQPTWWRWSR